MKLAVVGSRDYPQPSKTVADIVGRLVKGRDVCISGGARGVDSDAAQAARRAGVTVQEIKPDYKRFKETPWVAPIQRNTEIVDLAEAVLAFWDFKSSGTFDTIAKTINAGKPLCIVGPHGLTAKPSGRIEWVPMPHLDPIEFTDKDTGEVTIIDPMPPLGEPKGTLEYVDEGRPVSVVVHNAAARIVWWQFVLWVAGCENLAREVGCSQPVSGWLEARGGSGYSSARETMNALRVGSNMRPLPSRDRTALL